MKYDTIFFDIGNTLYFYNYDFLSGLLAERFDINVTGVELAEAHRMAQVSVMGSGISGLSHVELWNRTYLKWFELAGIDEEKAKRVIESIRNHPFRHLFWARVEDGTLEMLDWFRERGFKLGVISNAEGQITRLLEHTGMLSRFDVVIDSGEVGVAKPDTRIFSLAMEKMRTKPDRSIYVGDLLEIDIKGAKEAGMTPILIDREGNYVDAGCITVARAVDLPKLPMFSGA